MSRNPLGFQHLQGGLLPDRINAAIAQANAAIDTHGGGKKTKATVVLSIEIENTTDDGDFRAVSATVTVKAPAAKKKADMYAVGKVGGKRVLIVEDEPAADPKLPGIANMDDARTAV